MLGAGGTSARTAGSSAGMMPRMTPQAALVRLMTAPRLQPAWFTPAFLARVSLAQLAQGRASTEAMLGPFTGVRAQPGGSYFLLFRKGLVRTVVALDRQGRIAVLTFGAPKLNANRVDVGGHRLYVQCLGVGSPTVLLDAGLGNASEIWGLVQPEAARVTRVCAYDRAGEGGSDAGPRPRTSQMIVTDLHVLLARARIAGPYVLVGHSIAGFHARVYANRYPREVVGVVLVDASHPDQVARLLAALPPRATENPAVATFRAGLADTRPDPQEGFDFIRSAAQVRATRPLGSRPLVVLSHGRSPWPSDLPAGVTARLERVWSALQDQHARLSSDSVRVIGRSSGHFIQLDQPQLVIAAVQQVVEAARRHVALPPCARTFPRLGGDCPTPKPSSHA
jgi:pimeloyl-ACP methyl ester carboxylesterase